VMSTKTYYTCRRQFIPGLPPLLRFILPRAFFHTRLLKVTALEDVRETRLVGFELLRAISYDQNHLSIIIYQPEISLVGIELL